MVEKVVDQTEGGCLIYLLMETSTVTITAVLSVVGQPIQHGELQKALEAYRKRKDYMKLKMREYRAKRPSQD